MQLIYTIIPLKSVCLSVCWCSQTAGRNSCSIVSGDVSNCSYRLTVVYILSRVRVSGRPRFFYTPKTPKTSGKSGRERVCLFQWQATDLVASGAGPHGWAPTNSDNLYGDGGVCVFRGAHACALSRPNVAYWQYLGVDKFTR